MSDLEFNERMLSLRDRLYHFALSLTRDLADAEDLIQDSLMKALTNRSKFREGTNFNAWMHTIVRNTFINQHRRAKRGRVVMENAQEADLAITRTSMNIDPVSSLSAKEIMCQVEQLPGPLNTPLMMNANGFKYQEIADQLQIPVGTVKSRIFEARKRLSATLRHAQRRTCATQ